MANCPPPPSTPPAATKPPPTSTTPTATKSCDTPTGKTLYLGTTDINTNAAGTSITGVTRYYSQNGVTVASRNDPGTLSWIANNDQNTAEVVIDQQTLAVSTRRQDPFGNTLGAPPTWPNRRGFVGGTTEPDGLVHLGPRMYDPTTGRFTSDDSVTDTSGPQQLNGYAYASNSPVTSSDPGGRFRDNPAVDHCNLACDKLVAGGHGNGPDTASLVPGDRNSTAFQDGSLDGYLDMTAISLLIAPEDAAVFTEKVGMRSAGFRAAVDLAPEEGDGGRLLWTTRNAYPKVTVEGQDYANIGGRLYSKHAVDRMQPSGLRFIQARCASRSSPRTLICWVLPALRSSRSLMKAACPSIVSAHRRSLLGDVLSYRERRRAAQYAALEASFN